MRFSQRHGHRPVKNAIQRDSMDDDLRVGLWNVLTIYVLDHGQGAYGGYQQSHRSLTFALWISFLKKPLDTMPGDWNGVVSFLRPAFWKWEWFDVYDFLEFIAEETGTWNTSEAFRQSLNKMLEMELSGYRLVGNRLVEITSDEEITAIEDALADAKQPFRTHIERALDLIADRKNPDYRNSIKESISAVEALVNALNSKKGTLGQALKKLGVDTHPALEDAFVKLYAYTSDANGIRHALMEKESDLGFEDAKFMLVSCSAFVNYLLAKAARANINV